MANQNSSSSDVKRHQPQKASSSSSSNTWSCSDSSERSSILDDLPSFSDIVEQSQKKEEEEVAASPIRRPSRRTPSSIKRSLLKRKSWVDCDWEVMEQECYSSEDDSEDEDMDKRIPLFDDCQSDENDKGGDSAATDQAAPPHNPLRPRIRRGSLHEVILNEDSPVISGCARPKLRRRGTMEEKVMQDGGQYTLHYHW
jgi:hypothetical protein